MAEPAFSVVVPTYDRMDVLPEVLDALEGQRGAPPFEVVVVDDGSGEATREFLAARRFAVPARVLIQENRGPAAARNAGVRAAAGRRVAFLGDDTVPTPGWLAAHAGAHEARGGGPELAVIGYTRWHPRVRTNPFLTYINEHGLQFGYRLIDDPEDVPFNFFYTSNLSLSRERLLAEPFDVPLRRLGGHRGLLPPVEGGAAAGLRAPGGGAPRPPHDAGALLGAPGEGRLRGDGLPPAPPGARVLPRTGPGGASAASSERASAAPGATGPGLAEFALEDAAPL